jgi:3-hydroxybutyryl-CoA dehydrogenase
MEIKFIGVVGSGQMGSGIAEAAVVSGFQVCMRDIAQEALDRGRRRIVGDLERRVQKGKMPPEEREAILGRLTVTTRLEELKACDFIIEAATENVALKGEIFKALDGLAKPGVILASNTSSISITRIGSFTQRPDRVIGMHFFNPVPAMKLIEVIRGVETSEETFRVTQALCERLGKTPLEAKDYPGFVSSRLIFSYMNEGIFTLYEGLGTARDIDEIMKLGANHPMGPLELADYVGLDTVLSVMRVLQEAFGDKYRPCPLLVKLVEAGRLGVKTGRGIYDYEEKR